MLIVEDNRNDIELTEYALKREHIKFTLRPVQSEAALRYELEHAPPDIILSDSSLPSFDGSSALKITKTLRPDIPFIFVTGNDDREIAAAMLNNGAIDYILKTELKKLPAAILRALENSTAKNKSE